MQVKKVNNTPYTPNFRAQFSATMNRGFVQTHSRRCAEFAADAIDGTIKSLNLAKNVAPIIGESNAFIKACLTEKGNIKVFYGGKPVKTIHPIITDAVFAMKEALKKIAEKHPNQNTAGKNLDEALGLNSVFKSSFVCNAGNVREFKGLDSEHFSPHGIPIRVESRLNELNGFFENA